MLALLDVAIGFATVMLAVSLIIMSLTQAALSAMALRGAKLRLGLESLIREAVPRLNDQAKGLSQQIVSHPLVCDAATLMPLRWRWASALRKEELLPVLTAVLDRAKITITPEEQNRIEQWFEPFMTRVSQWFVMNTRWTTGLLAVVLSFTMHLDSGHILTQLTADTETRAKVVAMSASLLDQAPVAVGHVETVYREALAGMAQGTPDKFKEAEALPAAIKTRQEARDWIGRNAAEGATPELLETYDGTVDHKLTEAIDKSIDRAKTLERSLQGTGVLLDVANHTYHDWFEVRSAHFWGMVTSALFLSLGAPFWFNLLKSMTSLKSAVAIKDEESKPPVAKDDRTAAAPVARTLPALPPAPATGG